MSSYYEPEAMKKKSKVDEEYEENRERSSLGLRRFSRRNQRHVIGEKIVRGARGLLHEGGTYSGQEIGNPGSC